SRPSGVSARSENDSWLRSASSRRGQRDGRPRRPGAPKPTLDIEPAVDWLMRVRHISLLAPIAALGCSHDWDAHLYETAGVAASSVSSSSSSFSSSSSSSVGGGGSGGAGGGEAGCAGIAGASACAACGDPGTLATPCQSLGSYQGYYFELTASAPVRVTG